MTRSSIRAWRVGAAVVLLGARARSDEETPRAPMPEPIFTETVTDVDGDEAGEIEVELNGSHRRSVRGGVAAFDASVELEWLVTRKLGVRAEPFVGSRVHEPPDVSAHSVGANAGVSWKLIQDFAHDFHLQAELAGRYPGDTAKLVDAGDSALPYAFDLRWGARAGRFTVRGALGGEAGGTAAHAPLRESLALLTGFATTERYGFWGVEIDVDGARRSPVAVALDLVPSIAPLGAPFRIGVAIPWAIGARATEPQTGIFVRIFFESARETEYAKRASD